MLFRVPAGERKKMCVLSKCDFCLRHTGWGSGGLCMCPGALAGESKETRTPHPASLGMILYISNAILGNSFIWLACWGENQEGGRLPLTSASAGWSSFLTTTAVICPSPSPHLLGDSAALGLLHCRGPVITWGSETPTQGPPTLRSHVAAPTLFSGLS